MDSNHGRVPSDKREGGVGGYTCGVVNRVFTYVIKPHIAYRIWLLSDRKEIGIESAKSKET